MRTVLARRMHRTPAMTDKMLFSLSIFLTGLGAGIALVALVAPRSRAIAGQLAGSKSHDDLLKAKAR
jgi:hypothetical protein